MLPVEFYVRHVLQTRMRSHLVVMTAPVLDQNAGHLSRSEPPLVQTLIAKPPIEALIAAVVPGVAGVVQHGLDIRFSDPAITDPRVLPCQSPPRIDHQCVTLGSCRLIAQHRSGDLLQLVRPSLRMAPLNCQSHLLSTHLRFHHFRRLISLSVSIAISRSASIRFRRAFSASRLRSFFTSLASSTPNFFLMGMFCWESQRKIRSPPQISRRLRCRARESPEPEKFLYRQASLSKKDRPEKDRSNSC